MELLKVVFSESNLALCLVFTHLISSVHLVYGENITAGVVDLHIKPLHSELGEIPLLSEDGKMHTLTVREKIRKGESPPFHILHVLVPGATALILLVYIICLYLYYRRKVLKADDQFLPTGCFSSDSSHSSDDSNVKARRASTRKKSMDLSYDEANKESSLTSQRSLNMIDSVET